MSLLSPRSRASHGRRGQKFGGTSVANAERIMAAARRAIRAKQAGNQVIVVVSARGDTTDELIELAREITEHPPAREMDMLLATGEQISIALMAMAIQTLGEPAISFTGAQVGIVTDRRHTKARIKNISTERMRQASTPGRSSSSPASRASTRSATSRPWAAAARTPPPSPWPPC